MKKTFLVASVMLAFSGSAMALPMTLSDVTGLSGYDSFTDTGDQIFALTDTGGGVNDASAFLMFEFAGNRNINKFGIVGSDGVGGLNHLQIFGGSAGAGYGATIEWDLGTDTATTSFGSTMIDDQLFGFYLEGAGGDMFYTVDALNQGFEDVVASFDVNSIIAGPNSLAHSNFVFGFEDVYGLDYDYNDFIVGVSDIRATGATTFDTPSPVPAPAPLALMGLGLIGLAGIKGKKKADARKKA